MAGGTDRITLAREGHVATVTLNRPDKLNALTRDMWADLGELFEQLARETDLRCVVLRGAGGKAFSPGNDISEFADVRSNVEQGRVYGAIMAATLKAVKTCPVPVVALIEGICVGGGLEIACCCDIRICGASSRFGVPVNRLGLVMSHAELSGLLDVVGRANAARILYEGEVFGPERALAMGLVSAVVADGDVEKEAYAAAERIAAGAPLVNRWHKQFMARLADPAPLSPAEIDEGYHCFGTEDFATGYQAFLDKKKPDFKGR